MIRTFTPFEFIILGFVSLAGGMGMLLKTKAFQYEMAGRLSILAYFSVVFTFLFDYIFIGTEFTKEEATGITIVFLANMLSAGIVFKKNFLKKEAKI